MASLRPLYGTTSKSVDALQHVRPAEKRSDDQLTDVERFHRTLEVAEKKRRKQHWERHDEDAEKNGPSIRHKGSFST